MAKSAIRAIAFFAVRRPVFSLLSLLCVATLVVWVGTSEDRWSWRTDWNEANPVMFFIEDGQVVLGRFEYPPVPLAEETEPGAASNSARREFSVGGLGLVSDTVSIMTVHGPPVCVHVYIGNAPLWLIGLLFAAYPLFACYRFYRDRAPPPRPLPQLWL